MSSITHTRSLPHNIDPRRLGAAAGILAGPLFLTVVAFLTWAELDYLHGLGWHYTKKNDVPWPSATALGPHGWIQILNFAVAGLLLLAFARSFRAELHGKTGRIGAGLMTLLALGLVVSAFPTDDASAHGHQPNTWHGWIHSIGFIVIVLSSLLAPILVALALRRDPRRRVAALLCGAAPVLMIVMFIPAANTLHDLGFTGYLAVVFGWQAMLAYRPLRGRD